MKYNLATASQANVREWQSIPARLVSKHQLRLLGPVSYTHLHSKTYPDKGCKGTIDILKKSEADVILMVETYGAAPMVADSLGYSYNPVSYTHLQVKFSAAVQCSLSTECQ